MKLKRAGLLVVCSGIFLLLNFSAYAQNTEAELKSNAEKAYKAESFVEASKLYSQLLAFNVADPLYNYRYGVCLIYNSRKKQDAIKHLTHASKQAGFDPEVFYYLGKAYHLNYEFPEAITNYEKYKAAVGTKLNPELDVNRQIEMSENGKRLLSSMNQMVVLEKKEIETGNFFRIYDLRDIGGDIIVNAQFQSKIDKKKKHVPLIHFPAKPSMIFYSSYGEDEKRGKDIFIRRRLPDGTWSLPQTVNGGVNTPFDEDYPYLHPNGKYLYFCSKGHNSMGGFDVFRSKYDKENNTFGPAENLDFAISSPDNDLLYVVDSLDKNAYFASARQSQDGKIHVYKVRVEQFKDQLAVVKAAFTSSINPTNKKVSVEIYDYTSNAKIGLFNSTEKGVVIITFPKGGKYEYRITVNGGDEEYTSVVSIPFLQEFKPLKQQLIHEMLDGKETVRIVNLFDENVEDPVATLREIAQMRSELNPNADQFDLDKIDQRSANKELYTQLGMDKLSDLEVKEAIEKLAEKQEKQSENIRNLERKALDIVVNNSKEIGKLQLELKTTVALADSKQDGERRALFEEAGRLVNELNSLENQAKSLIPTADSLNNVAKNLEANDQKVRQLSNSVSEAYQKGDMAKMATLLQENKAQIQDLQKENTDLATDKITKEIVAIREEIKKLTQQQKEFLDTKLQIKQDLAALDKQLAEAKTKEQPAIQKKIESKLEEAKMVDDELKRLENRMKTIAENEQKLLTKLAYYQEIQNASVPATKNNSADAQKILQASDNPNNRTLEAYVEQQTKELGIDMLALKPNKKTDTNGTNQNVSSSNPTEGNNMANNTSKTNEPEKNKNPEGGQTNTVNSDPKNKVEGNPVKSVEMTTGQQQLVASVSPDYQQNVSNISNDPLLTEEQKLKALQRQEKDMKFLVAKEIASVQDQLKQNPADAALQTRLKELNQINETLKTRIDTKQNELSAKYPESNPPVKLTESQLTNLIKPHHNAMLNAIADDNQLDEMQRMDKSQTEDQKFLGALMQQKNRLEDELSRDALNVKNKHELGLIKNLIAETEKRIEERTMGMASYQTGTNPVKTNNNGQEGNNTASNATTPGEESLAVINKLNPTYSKEIDAIKGNAALSEKEKQIKLIAEEDKLQTALDEKIAEVEKELKANPVNQQLLNEKQQLEVIRDESQNRESEAKQLVVSDAKKSLSKEDLLAQTDKTYTKDIAALQAKPSEQNTQKAKLREEKLQQLLQKRMEANQKKMAVKEDLSLLAENQVLAEMIDESKARTNTNVAVENKNNGVTNPNNSEAPKTAANPKTTEQLRKDLLGTEQKTATQDFTALEDLKKQRSILEAYNTKLSDKLTATEKQLASKPDNKKLLEEQTAIRQEQEWVKEKLRKVGVSIGELEQQTIANPQNPVEKNDEQNFESKEIKALKTEQADLEAQLSDPKISKKQTKVLQTQLAENKTKQADLNEKQLLAQAEILKQNPPDKMAKKTKSPQSEVLVSLDSLYYKALKENEALLKEKSDNLDKTKKAGSRLELLNEIDDLQQENGNLSSELVYETRLIIDVKTLEGENANTPLSLESKATLEKRKYRVGVEIGELETQILKDEEQLKKAKSKEKTALQRALKRKEKELSLLKKELDAVNQELAQREVVAGSLQLSNASVITVDPEETAELSSKGNYTDLKTAFEQKELAKIDAKMDYDALEKAKSRYSDASRLYAAQPNGTNKKGLTDALGEVKLKNTAYLQSKKAFEASENTYMNLAKEESSLTKLESLFLKGVTQSQPFTVKTSSGSPVTSSSDYAFRVLETPASDPVEARIPIGASMPMGLVYRVQVGAFRKPLKTNLFNEFTPVTGELIKTGITRYISGYFGSILTASEAKKQIRSLGYKDAFIVAYCDGKRITIAEAKRLEAKGECVPSAEIAGSSVSSNPAISENKNTNGDKPNTEKNTPVNKVDKKEKTNNNPVENNAGDYNKAPGAVKAIAVETKLGLFYTVQIGAYTNPASSKQLKYIENVVSKKLDDGKIRYSTGIFSSVADALPTKQMAIEKGVTDAFVTAYYKGDRITLAEAERLLKENGSGILEKGQ